MILGLGSVIVGVLLIRHPIHGVVAVALLLALWLIISGMVRFASALNADQRRGWNMAVAVIELVAGIVIVSSPGIGVSTLALFAGVSLVVRGVALCGLGWLLPHLPAQTEAEPSGTLGAT